MVVLPRMTRLGQPSHPLPYQPPSPELEPYSTSLGPYLSQYSTPPSLYSPQYSTPPDSYPLQNSTHPGSSSSMAFEAYDFSFMFPIPPHTGEENIDHRNNPQT
ncbi:hypothetical protein PVK06_043204 [Gossypium arboreum]|uniref:Uncharacterized protein n=1 Tax=Gossypium arboreum TaxID=29729 RepID=A0ABR0MMU3_GOSAR|nr:hypothetical protein PVK06_043204 [Gossypium arboreum]